MISKLIVSDEYFSLIDNVVIDDILVSSPASKELYQSNNEWCEALIRYIILTYGEARTPYLSPESLFTSRYYWFKKFYHSYSISNGEDCGMLQQIGNLVEEMYNSLPNYDWNLLEEISKEIEGGHSG